jgi:hypothetical protein
MPTSAQQVILSVVGIPSALIAGWVVELPLVGRRGALAVSAGEYTLTPRKGHLLNNRGVNVGLTGAFLFASTTARSSPALLGWNCGYALFSNVGEPDPRHDLALADTARHHDLYCTQMMYSVLSAVSPEVFPANHRGTGNGLAATVNHGFGILVRHC